MSRNLILPDFPVAPTEYDPRYMAQVVRSFSVFLRQFQNPGEARATKMTLTNLQSNDYGLEVGAIFEQDGFLKITKAGTPHPVSFEVTSAVGQVSITTT